MAQLPSGHLAMRALKQGGVDHLFTLSGAHIFPLYDGCRYEDVRLVDVRHEQTAAFGAEGLAKLTRQPQVAAVTAGPGVTNAMSAIAAAQVGRSPLLIIGGRAPLGTWGQGSLQEIDHVPFVAPLTKFAATAETPESVAATAQDALRIAGTPQRGPTFVDVPMDVIFSPAGEETVPGWRTSEPFAVDLDEVESAAGHLRDADRPVIIGGTDVWFGGAWEALGHLAERLHAPVLLNGMGRGCLPPDHELAFQFARGAALKGADLVLAVGTPLDFRLAHGRFGEANVIHLADHPEGLAQHVELAAGVGGDLVAALTALAGAVDGDGAQRRAWVDQLRDAERAKHEDEAHLLEAEAAPIHPVRVYGELRRVLDADAVVICDGGDFVSFAGRYISSRQPGRWLDPGPYGCLGTGMGYAIAARLAHPGAQVCVLLGDGAAGFSLMDVDSLVRHNLPVVMVCGNNGIWGLEKFPMQQIYDGWDIAADLQPGLRYEEVVKALGGAGETVEKAADIGPALDRAFASGVPYLVNVLTDPTIPYPRGSSSAA
ncbi:MAG: acetolactate synthase [Nitriliruptorales bacterium]|nr:acetolactate synthase [Nitriliruptorales bacterium]